MEEIKPNYVEKQGDKEFEVYLYPHYSIPVKLDRSIPEKPYREIKNDLNGYFSGRFKFDQETVKKLEKIIQEHERMGSLEKNKLDKLQVESMCHFDHYGRSSTDHMLALVPWGILAGMDKELIEKARKIGWPAERYGPGYGRPQAVSAPEMVRELKKIFYKELLSSEEDKKFFEDGFYGNKFVKKVLGRDLKDEENEMTELNSFMSRGHVIPVFHDRREIKNGEIIYPFEVKELILRWVSVTGKREEKELILSKENYPNIIPQFASNKVFPYIGYIGKDEDGAIVEILENGNYRFEYRPLKQKLKDLDKYQQPLAIVSQLYADITWLE